MNKLSITFISLIVLTLVFTVAYKLGDAHGYADGYQEGYRYDCKEEIGTLYNRVKHLSTAVKYTDSTMKHVLRENDSLKNPAYAQKRYDDSIAAWAKYSQDSIEHSIAAQRKNDSIASVVGFASNFYNHDGKFNPMVCISPDIEKKLAECRKHSAFIKIMRGN